MTSARRRRKNKPTSLNDLTNFRPYHLKGTWTNKEIVTVSPFFSSFVRFSFPLFAIVQQGFAPFVGVCDDILSSSELPTLPFVFKGNFYVCGWRTSLPTRPTKRKSRKRVFKNHQNRHSIYRKNCQFLRVEHHVLNWLTLPLKFQIHSEEIWFDFFGFQKLQRRWQSRSFLFTQFTLKGSVWPMPANCAPRGPGLTRWFRPSKCRPSSAKRNKRPPAAPVWNSASTSKHSNAGMTNFPWFYFIWLLFLMFSNWTVIIFLLNVFVSNYEREHDTENASRRNVFDR